MNYDCEWQMTDVEQQIKHDNNNNTFDDDNSNNNIYSTFSTFYKIMKQPIVRKY